MICKNIKQLVNYGLKNNLLEKELDGRESSIYNKTIIHKKNLTRYKEEKDEFNQYLYGSTGIQRNV